MGNGNFGYFLRNLRRKHRLSIHNAADEEVWYSHTTLLKVATTIFGVAVLLFVAGVLVSAYTSLLDIMPGYMGNKVRREMTENILRIDSLASELESLAAYTDNVALIMEGRTPVDRNISLPVDTIATDKTLVAASKADSLLRAEMEGSGRYGLNRTPSRPRGELADMEFLSPYRGDVKEAFSQRNRRFGTMVEVTNVQQVFAIQAGTIISALWNPEEGYVVQIQHKGNFLSVYKNLSQVLKAVGDRVQVGEAIGAVWHNAEEGTPTVTEFQLWYDGQAVDPQNYVEF
ncbi:MAG: M23 family metallopeptidase [Tidjanibacter sp.]|nr:M23 family metallopeptidase [Tidjanibacter sp.]